MEPLGQAAARVLERADASRRGIEIRRPASREEWLAGRETTTGARANG